MLDGCIALSYRVTSNYDEDILVLWLLYSCIATVFTIFFVVLALTNTFVVATDIVAEKYQRKTMFI